MTSHATLDLSIANGVASVTFDHGDVNLLDGAMMVDINEVVSVCETDPDIRVVVWQSANPNFFLAHVDLNLFSEPPANRPGELPFYPAVVARLQALPKPTIAKIAGRARGGGFELTLACDMRFGALGHCILALPEVGAGLIPGAGGSINLPAIVGYGRACEIILGSSDISAERAEMYGLLNRALPIDELDAYVDRLARQMAEFSPRSIASAKTCLQANLPNLHQAMLRESEAFAQTLTEETRTFMLAAAQQGGQSLEMELKSIDDVREMMRIRS